jgi:hypothetical protein
MKGPFLPKRVRLNNQDWIWHNSDELNHAKYDSRIESQGYWPFMLSWYWNSVCKHWGAYVKGDYQDVFPVCRQWKWGFVPMLVTPYCVKWIECDSSIAEYLISNVKGFKNLSFPFEVKGSKPSLVQVLTKNELWKPSGDLKRNVKKAEQQGYQFSATGNWESFAQLMKKHHPYPWKKYDEALMEKLYRNARERGYGFISEVMLGGEVVASYFFILRKSQLLFVQNVTNVHHKGGSPMALLIYSILENISADNNHPEVHFMGSANTGVAEYNKKFGATDFEYFRLKNY